MQVKPRPVRISLHAFALEDGHLQRVWGETLYQVRLHFERVASQGSCDIRLEVRAGADDAEAPSDVPLERELLP